MSDLSELIRINKNIEYQNKEIIRLLKIIASEKDFTDKSGYIGPDFKDSKSEKVEFGECNSLLDNDIGVGEVYFIDGDIFRYSVQNNKGVFDNLMGGDNITNFTFAKTISNESIKRNQSIVDSTVILTDSSKGKLPQTLKTCHEYGAKKVLIPFNQLTELLGAPESLQKILKLNFYRNEEELIQKLFEDI